MTGDGLRRATAGSLMAAVLVAACLVVTFAVLLHPPEPVSCNTSLLDSPFRTALVPVHLAAAAVLSLCLWVLSAHGRGARIPGRPTLWALAGVWAYALASVAEHDLFGVIGMVAVVAAPTIGLVALVVLIVRALLVERSAAPPRARWLDHARSTQLLLWGGLVLGLPASVSYAWLSGASFFCF
jgi:hypothetical protein